MSKGQSLNRLHKPVQTLLLTGSALAKISNKDRRFEKTVKKNWAASEQYTKKNRGSSPTCTKKSVAKTKGIICSSTSTKDRTKFHLDTIKHLSNIKKINCEGYILWTEIGDSSVKDDFVGPVFGCNIGYISPWGLYQDYFQMILWTCLCVICQFIYNVFYLVSWSQIV